MEWVWRRDLVAIASTLPLRGVVLVAGVRGAVSVSDRRWLLISEPLTTVRRASIVGNQALSVSPSVSLVQVRTFVHLILPGRPQEVRIANDRVIVTLL